MSKGKLLAICLIWLFLAGCAAVAWKFIIVPSRQKHAEQEKREQLDATSDDSPYQDRINFGIDGFSGYAVFRSDEFRQALASERIGLHLKDDGANYAKRLEGLRNGELQMATFTIDALIKASSNSSDLPAVIVAIIDETRGADAMIASKQAVANIEALDNPETRFFLTPDSPSETLTRVVMSEFKLDNLSEQQFVRMDGPEETLREFQKTNPTKPNVFVTWEPYVSRMLEDKNMAVVIDSSRFRGYIVDVIVVSRDYLDQNGPFVQKFLGCYFKTLYGFRNSMTELVKSDAKKQSQQLTDEQANRLTAGIRWKNTQENFAHFDNDHPSQHIYDMIMNITKVLKDTGAISFGSHRRKFRAVNLRQADSTTQGKQFSSWAFARIDCFR